MSLPPLPGSCPGPYVQEKLVKIAKKLKKNNVAVDVVSFGAEDENQVSSADSGHRLCDSWLAEPRTGDKCQCSCSVLVGQPLRHREIHAPRS